MPTTRGQSMCPSSSKHGFSSIRVEGDDEDQWQSIEELQALVEKYEQKVDNLRQATINDEAALQKRLVKIRLEASKFAAIIAKRDTAEKDDETSFLKHTAKKTCLDFLRTDKHIERNNPTSLARKIVVELIDLVASFACNAEKLPKDIDDVVFQAFELRLKGKRLEDIGFDADVIEGLLVQMAKTSGVKIDGARAEIRHAAGKWQSELTTGDLPEIDDMLSNDEAAMENDVQLDTEDDEIWMMSDDDDDEFSMDEDEMEKLD
ncbi:unnamed protein product, partial [Mesorhabditis belari]|uniref:Uncharacterized protein n=1 Tax=Mesorhabditis belari TaxID=2138241 RepID=A0AAF3FG47_9BILA